ncbi:glycerophosphodiester phosphodiesterase family protein [Actinospongicola halichondriae]|uniref:glycerophosphodiester phosphodiesterase family protein n=1 Tax=Actinospongicola halichondriae TaxID=3236844 RepID=UPI003D44AE27
MRRLLVSLVVGLVVLAGCAGDDDAAPDSTSTTAADATTTSVPLAPPTVDELLAGDRVLDIPHAGGDQDFPHSTMYAFAESVAAGADVLEFDIWTTADDVVVVHHDADTAKTTPESLVVAETDLATLQELDKAYWFSPECWPCQDRPEEEYVFRGIRTGDVAPPEGYTPDDFRLVTLEELSERFPEIPFDIEIKGEGDIGVRNAEALAAALDDLGRTDSTVVVSFDSAVIAAFHEAAPDVATSPGVAEMTAWLLEGEPLAAHHRVVQVPPVYSGVEVLTEESIARAHADGLAIWVWMDTPSEQENEDFYRTLVAMDIDGIIAGRPGAARRAID